MFHFFLRLFSLLIFLVSPVAIAADPVWQLISDEGGRRIEVDRSSIKRDGDKVEARGRVILGRDIIDLKSDQNYREIEAITRYNCQTRQAATLKRIYRQGEMVLREEDTKGNDLPVRGGTIDDKMLREVCRPPLDNPKNVANAVNEAAEKLRAANENMLKTAGNAATEKSDKKTKVKPEKSGKKAEAKPEKTEPVDIKPKEKLEKTETKKPVSSAEMNPVVAPKKEEKMEMKAPAPAPAPAKAATPQMLPDTKPKTEEKIAMKSPPSFVSLVQKPRAEEKPLPLPKKQEKISKANADTAMPFMLEIIPAASPLGLEMLARGNPADWAYSGDKAPAYWGKIKPEYRLCNEGQRQSPIDVQDSLKVDLAAPNFDYHSAPFAIADNGHTVQVALRGGKFTLTGKSFELEKIQFRRPAEEMINGQRYEMSVHLMHRATDGQWAIVVVPLQTGAENAFIQTLWNYLPLEKGTVSNPPEIRLNPEDLLPSKRQYVTYLGSLTYPPCTENVLWIILKTPMPISTEQIQIFSHFYRNNSRPIQADGGRLIKESRETGKGL